MRRFKLLFLCSLGLDAQAQIHLSPNEAYSQEQARVYCQELGPKWRQPDIKEIFALPRTIPFREGYSYWSASTITSGNAVIGTGSEGDGGVMETLGFSFYPKERNVTFSPQWKKIAPICTDEPLSPKPVSHYLHTAEGTVDEESGLLWHNLEATDKRVRYTHAEAEAMCDNLTLHGRAWRLPTTDELYGIVDYSFVRPTLDMNYFGSVMHRYYWTSDTLNEKEAYVVGFKLGSVATAPKKEATHARCVSDPE